ncbi:site-specific integrase [Caldibacillus debilis]|uniref:site-specific integrase n=1 Tax=Caldibacillus debilis TaxID=301148 RepID=UPI000E37CA29|nr:site-specific integrase [Caldibacillus debilis]REJ29253.1 MAG: site-specific integrase [Caldibacillus debilis]
MAKGYARPRGNGKWQLEVNLGSYVDPKTGKRKRIRKFKEISAKNQRQADLELAKFVAEITGNNYFEPEKINFVEFVQKEWLPVAEKRLSHTTLTTHIRYLNLRILPAFQYLRLDQIKPKHIIDFLRNLEEEGMRADGKGGKLSSSTIFYHYRILNNIFNYAKEIKLIKESPLEGVKKPKVEYKDIEVYSPEEAARLIKCLETEPLHWQVIIKLAVTTGMRRSELLGLEFKHIDLDNRIVHIRQALTYSKHSGYQIHEIKKGSRSARIRDVVISEALVDPIKRLYSQRETERDNSSTLWMDGKYNFVLAHEDGKPYNPYSLQNWWKRFIKRHGLKYINFHALRHTSATLLINEGVHAKVISERLGHSDIKTTMNVYGHVFKKADELAATKLDEVLFKTNKDH